MTIRHPEPWYGAKLRSTPDPWLALDDAARAELVAAATTESLSAARAVEHHAGPPAPPPLPLLSALLDRARRACLDGPGIVLLRGLPVDELDPEAVERMFAALAARLGEPLVQSPRGDRIGRVTDAADRDERPRAYRSRRELRMHTDAGHLVFMLCVRPASEGGESSFTSARAVYDELKRWAPDCLPILRRGFFYLADGGAGAAPGEVTRERVPVFSVREGTLSCVFIRAYIEQAAAANGRPLHPLEVRALDEFEAIAHRKDLRLDVALKAGDAFLLDNLTVLHSRTAFVDHADPARRRLFLRAWLRVENGPPVAPAVKRFSGL